MISRPVEKIDVFKTDGQALANSKASNSSKADRGHRGWVFCFKFIQRPRQGCQFGWRQHPVARFLAGLLDPPAGVCMLWSQFPRLEQIKQTRQQGEYPILRDASPRPGSPLNIRSLHVRNLDFAECWPNAARRLLPIRDTS